MADGAFHTRGRGVVVLGHAGIKLLGHSVDDIGRAHRHQNGITEIVVSLDMGRNADLVQNLRHLDFQRFLPLRGRGDRRWCEIRDLHHTLRKLARVKRGHHEIGCARSHHLALNRGTGKVGKDQKNGNILFTRTRLHHTDPVQTRHKQIRQNDVGTLRLDLFQQHPAVAFRADHRHSRLFQSRNIVLHKFSTVFRNQNF